jgi:hypothetical protein
MSWRGYIDLWESLIVSGLKKRVRRGDPVLWYWGIGRWNLGMIPVRWVERIAMGCVGLVNSSHLCYPGNFPDRLVRSGVALGRRVSDA